jgi:competence protein ComEC
MCFWNPFIVLYDPSFHLSVIATCGIMYVTPIVEKYISFVTKRFGLRELSATTLGAQLSVLPYILYISGNFGVFAFPANFLVLPFVPLTMLLGFLTAVLGLASRFLGLLPGLSTYALLWWDLFTARLVSKLPFANIHLPYIPLSLLIIFYVILGFFVYRFHVRQNPSGTSMVHSGDDSVVSY